MTGDKDMLTQKIMVISHSFPPFLDASSIAVAKFVKYLERNGCSTTVICGLPPRSKRLLSLFDREIDVSLMEFVPQNTGVVRVPDTIYEFAIRAMGRFIKTLKLLPDYNFGWFWKASNVALKVLREEQAQVLLSYAMPATCSLVGLRVKRVAGIPWVAYFSDPWIDNPYFKYPKVAYFANEKMERRVIENADAVVFPSERIRELVMRKYPGGWKAKTFVIPHPLDPELIRPIHKGENNKITFAYVGRLYHKRKPDFLFEAIKRILKDSPEVAKRIQVLLVGYIEPRHKKMIRDFGIHPIVSHIEPVPYVKSLEFMMNADVLLLIDAPSELPSVFLPSKLVDYISTLRPILALTPVQGESADVVRKVNGIVVEPDDIEGIEQALIFLVKHLRENDTSAFAYSRNNITGYDANLCVQRLIDIFSKII